MRRRLPGVEASNRDAVGYGGSRWIGPADGPVARGRIPRTRRRHQLHFVSQPLGANADYLIVPGRDGTRARVGVLPFIGAVALADR